MFILKVIPALLSQLLRRFRAPLTELLPMFLSLPRTSKTGIKKINQRTKESHSMTGLLRIRKSLRLSFFLLVQSKEPKTTSTSSLRASRSSTGSGRRRLIRNFPNSTLQTHNLKTSSKNFSISPKVKTKLVPS